MIIALNHIYIRIGKNNLFFNLLTLRIKFALPKNDNNAKNHKL